MKNLLAKIPLTPQQLALALLVGLAVLLLGSAALALARHRRDRRTARLRSLGGPSDELEGFDSSRVAASLGSVGRTVSAGRFSQELSVQLARAGYSGPAAAAVYVGSKIILLLVGLACGGMAAIAGGLPFHVGLLVTIFLGCLLFFVPNLHVMTRREKRVGEMSRRLPDAVDLLEICVSSGMGLDMAWSAVANEVRRVSTILAGEMELTRLEISLGVPRTQAMRHMAERTGVEDISSLVALLVQAERFGASIVDALRTFAGTMREVQSKRAEESAEKMAVKLLFPMVLFIFPTLLIVMVGPAVMRIVEVMG